LPAVCYDGIERWPFRTSFEEVICAATSRARRPGTPALRRSWLTPLVRRLDA